MESKALIGTKVRRMCRERGISLTKLEELTGIGNGVVVRWDIYNPRVDLLKRVADYFGTTVDELLRDDEADTMPGSEDGGSNQPDG